MLSDDVDMIASLSLARAMVKKILFIEALHHFATKEKLLRNVIFFGFCFCLFQIIPRTRIQNQKRKRKDRENHKRTTNFVRRQFFYYFFPLLLPLFVHLDWRWVFRLFRYILDLTGKKDRSSPLILFFPS